MQDISGFYLENRGAFAIAYSEKQIVGMGAFRYISECQAELKRIAIRSDWQRQGYGSQLLAYLESQALKLRYNFLTIHVSSLQIAAQKLFVSNSYKEIKRQPWRQMERIYFEKQF